MKPNTDRLITIATTDIMNYKVYSKMKASLIDLYKSRVDFYDKARFDFNEHVSVMGLSDRKTFKMIASVLASYKDTFTKNEIKDMFFELFVKESLMQVDVNEDEDRISFSVAGEPPMAFFAEIVPVANYLRVCCGSDMIADADASLEKLFETKTKDMPDELKAATKQGLFIFSKYLNTVTESETNLASVDGIELTEKVLKEIDMQTLFAEACYFALRGLFETGFSSKDDMCFDIESRDRMAIRPLYESDALLKNMRCDKVADLFKQGSKVKMPSEAMQIEINGLKLPPMVEQEEDDGVIIYRCMRGFLRHIFFAPAKYVDDYHLLEMNNLTKQEIRRVVASSLYFAGDLGLSVPTTLDGNIQTIMFIINDMVQSAFALLLRKSRKNALQTAYKQADRDAKLAAKGEGKRKEKHSGDTARLEKLIAENKNLIDEQKKLKAEIKAKKDIEKKVRGEVLEEKRGVEARLAEAEAELEKLRAENDELKAELEDTDVALSEDTITKEDIQNVVRGKKILVWGARPEIADRLKEEYGDSVECVITGASQSSGNIPNGLLDKCDAVIISTNHTSHSMYYKAKEEIQASGLPCAHARKNVNSPERFGRLMYRALVGEGRNVEE